MRAPLAAVVLVAAAPAIAGQRTFRDGIVGCDNIDACRAVAAGEDISIGERTHPCLLPSAGRGALT